MGLVGCRGFFDNDSDIMSVLFSQGMWLLLIVAARAFVVWVVHVFSMESLILAQDERWRRA